MLVIGHRVHEQDLSAHLLRKKKFKHVLLPLVATRDQTYETSSGVWLRRKGELLRPDAFGPTISTSCVRAPSVDFEMLYQQDCDAQTLPAIRSDHFPTPSSFDSREPGLCAGKHSHGRPIDVKVRR